MTDTLKQHLKKAGQVRTEKKRSAPDRTTKAIVTTSAVNMTRIALIAG